MVFASNNLGKFREVEAFASSAGLFVHPQSEYGVTEIEETGVTFIENALIKARRASRHTGLPAIGDDSGLITDALNGAPGIYSSRYAGEKATDEANIQKLLMALKDVQPSQRTARFYCVMVYLKSAEDPMPLFCEGVLEGVITSVRQGQKGFGYDPVFFLTDHQCTVAELDAAEKNQISHRGQAIQKLVGRLKTDASFRATDRKK